jgi:hypothetical protein
LIFILDLDAESVEFRCIVVTEPGGGGYGKKVVRMIDEICREKLGRVRVSMSKVRSAIESSTD